MLRPLSATHHLSALALRGLSRRFPSCREAKGPEGTRNILATRKQLLSVRRSHRGQPDSWSLSHHTAGPRRHSFTHSSNTRHPIHVRRALHSALDTRHGTFLQVSEYVTEEMQKDVRWSRNTGWEKQVTDSRYSMRSFFMKHVICTYGKRLEG